MERDRWDVKADEVNEETCVPCDCGQCERTIAAALRRAYQKGLAENIAAHFAVCPSQDAMLVAENEKAFDILACHSGIKGCHPHPIVLRAQFEKLRSGESK